MTTACERYIGRFCSILKPATKNAGVKFSSVANYYPLSKIDGSFIFPRLTENQYRRLCSGQNVCVRLPRRTTVLSALEQHQKNPFRTLRKSMRAVLKPDNKQQALAAIVVVGSDTITIGYVAYRSKHDPNI